MELPGTIIVFVAVFLVLFQEGRTKTQRNKDLVDSDKSTFRYSQEETPTTTEDPLQKILPLVTFECTNRTGYYADVSFDCEVFHYCKADGSRFTFLCPPTSRFNQKYLICDYDTNDVDLCGKAERYYPVNDDFHPGDDSDVFVRTSALKNPGIPAIKKPSVYKHPSPWSKKDWLLDGESSKSSRVISSQPSSKTKPILSDHHLHESTKGEILRESSTDSKQLPSASSATQEKKKWVSAQQRSYGDRQEPFKIDKTQVKNHCDEDCLKKKASTVQRQRSPSGQPGSQQRELGTSYTYFQLTDGSSSPPALKPYDFVRHPSPTQQPSKRIKESTPAQPKLKDSKSQQRQNDRNPPSSKSTRRDKVGSYSSRQPPVSEVGTVHSYFVLNPPNNQSKASTKKPSKTQSRSVNPTTSQPNHRKENLKSSQLPPAPTRSSTSNSYLGSGRFPFRQEDAILPIPSRAHAKYISDDAIYTWDKNKQIWVPMYPKIPKESLQGSASSSATHKKLDDKITKTHFHGKIYIEKKNQGPQPNIFSGIPIFPLPRKESPSQTPAPSWEGHNKSPLPSPPPNRRYVLKKDPISRLYEAEFKKLSKKELSTIIKFATEESQPLGFAVGPGGNLGPHGFSLEHPYAPSGNFNLSPRQVTLDQPIPSQHQQLPNLKAAEQQYIQPQINLNQDRSVPLGENPIYSPSSIYNAYSGIQDPRLHLLMTDVQKGVGHRRKKRQLSSPVFFNQPFGGQFFNGFPGGSGSFNPFTSNPFRTSFLPGFGRGSGFGSSPLLPSLDASLGSPGLSLGSFGFPGTFGQPFANANTRGNRERGNRGQGDNDEIKINIDVDDGQRRPSGGISEDAIQTGRPSNEDVPSRPEGSPASPAPLILPVRHSPPTQHVPLNRNVLQGSPETSPIRNLVNGQRFSRPPAIQGNNHLSGLQHPLQYRPLADIYPLGPPARHRPFRDELRIPPQQGDDRRQYEQQNDVGPQYTIIDQPQPPERPAQPVLPPPTVRPNRYENNERPPPSSGQRNLPQGPQRPFRGVHVNSYPRSVYSPEVPLKISITLSTPPPPITNNRERVRPNGNRIPQVSRDSGSSSRRNPPQRPIPPPNRPSFGGNRPPLENIENPIPSVRHRPSPNGPSFEEEKLPPATPAPQSFEPFPTRSHDGLYITVPPDVPQTYSPYYGFVPDRGQPQQFNSNFPSFTNFYTRGPDGFYVTQPPEVPPTYPPQREKPSDNGNTETNTEPPVLYVRPLDINEQANLGKPLDRTRYGGRDGPRPSPGRHIRPRPTKVENISSRRPQDTTESTIPPPTDPPQEKHVISPPLDQSPFTIPSFYGPPPLNSFDRGTRFFGGGERFATDGPLSEVYPPSTPSSRDQDVYSRGHFLTTYGRDPYETPSYQLPTEPPSSRYEITTSAPQRHRGGDRRRPPQQTEEKDIEGIAEKPGFDEVPFGARISGSRSRSPPRRKPTTVATSKPRRVESSPSVATDNQVPGYRQQRRTTEAVVYLEKAIPQTTIKPSTTRRPVRRRRPQQDSPNRRPSVRRPSAENPSSSDLAGSQSFQSSDPSQKERQHIIPIGSIPDVSNGAFLSDASIKHRPSSTTRNKPESQILFDLQENPELANHRLTPLLPDKESPEEKRHPESISNVKIGPEYSTSVSFSSNSNNDKDSSRVNLPLRPPRPRIRVTQKPKEDNSRVIYTPPATFSPPFASEERTRPGSSDQSLESKEEEQKSKPSVESATSSRKEVSGSSLFERRPRPTLQPSVRKTTVRGPVYHRPTTNAPNEIRDSSTLPPFVHTSISVVRSAPRLVEDAFQRDDSSSTTTTTKPEDSDIKVPSPQRVYTSKNGGSFQTNPQRARQRLRQRKNRLNNAVKNDPLNIAESSADIVTAKESSTTETTTEIETTIGTIPDTTISASVVTSTSIKSESKENTSQEKHGA